MLGDIFGELGSWLIGDLLAPSTDRGRTWLNLVFSFIAVGAQIGAFSAVGNPLRGPQWAFGLMMLGVFLGIVAFVFSLACLVRLEGHRVRSGVSAALAGVALLWPLSLLIR
jgi:hypothetical protein